MTIEEVIEKSTIKFPGNIVSYQAENLLKYIAEELPGEIRYNISHKVGITQPQKRNYC